MNTLPRGLVSIVAAAILASASSARASIIESHESTTSTTDNYYNAFVLSNDLINDGQASLASATQEGNFNEDATHPEGLGIHGLAGTHDGIGQDGTSQAHTAFPYSDVVTLLYTLNTSSSETAKGYDITGVSVVAGWPSAGKFAQQTWSVYVATVDNPTSFTLLKSVNFNPYPGSLDYGYSHVSLTDDTGALATGVSAVKLSLSNNAAIISEIDVIGKATATPEPSTFAMVIAALTGLLAYAWRKRR